MRILTLSACSRRTRAAITIDKHVYCASSLGRKLAYLQLLPCRDRPPIALILDSAQDVLYRLWPDDYYFPHLLSQQILSAFASWLSPLFLAFPEKCSHRIR